MPIAFIVALLGLLVATRHGLSVGHEKPEDGLGTIFLGPTTWMNETVTDPWSA
jgi:hypothetical protein